MPINDGDYLAWYNEEITRYRGHEWQLTSYSIALSSAIVLFAKKSDTAGLIAPRLAALAISVFVLILIIAEVHPHKRLNEYRERRTRLLDGGDHRTADIKTPFLNSAFDKFYFFGFVLLPVAFGLAAVLVLLNN